METIKKINTKTMSTGLMKAVAEIINEHIECGDEEYTLKDYLMDLAQGGCESGFVSELIYYSDTEQFYKKYQDDINALLTEVLDGTGFYSMDKLFGDKWEESDPLAFSTNNQNLLSWFAFEETARSIGQNLGVEI